jgi:hypothetical protein
MGCSLACARTASMLSLPCSSQCKYVKAVTYLDWAPKLASPYMRKSQ